MYKGLYKGLFIYPNKVGIKRPFLDITTQSTRKCREYKSRIPDDSSGLNARLINQLLALFSDINTVRMLTHVLCKPTHFIFHSFMATMSYSLQTSFNSVVKDWAD